MIQLSAGTAMMTPQRRALGDDGGRQAAQRIGEPFVDGVGGDRRGRAFARAEDDAAGDQHFQADRAQHRELHQRPDDRHHQERVARLHAVGDEAHDHRGQGEQEEEGRADQPELLGGQMELGHDRLGGEPDHDLVGEVDQHEEKDQRGHAPRALERAILCCHWRYSLGHGCPLDRAYDHETGATAGTQGRRSSHFRDQPRAGCTEGAERARRASALRSISGRMNSMPTTPPATSRIPSTTKPSS